jgi:predicted metalloprotease with PDZ domain
VLNSADKRKAQYIDWISQAASAIAGINGRYPIDNAQVIITPIGAKREAVPWGEVQRGGSVAAHFFVDSFRPIQEFKDDWTAAHELSHMLVPYIDRDELWLSEGIASYYQNVARGKAGMISRETAWDKLLAGFGRGTRAARTESLSNSAGIMQMYWGGAAIYLMADIALRKRSKNKQTLGTVLQQFNQCCRPSARSWSGKRLMKKFDELSQSNIFTNLYNEQAKQRRFPDVLPVLKEIGFDSLKRNKARRLSYGATAIMR